MKSANKTYREVEFRKQKIYVYDGRIPQEERVDGLYYYETRHGDNDFDTPLTIELGVFINFRNTVISQTPFKFRNKIKEFPALRLNLAEQQDINYGGNKVKELPQPIGR